MADYDFDDAPYVVIEKHEGSFGNFLVGLAVGAGLALFFAPQSGIATRRAVRQRADRVKQAAQDLAEDVTDTVTDRFQQARQEVEDRIENARSAVEMKKAQVQRAVQAGREAAHSARDDLERRIAETKAAYDEPVRTTRAGKRAASTSSTAADPDAGEL